MSSIDLACGSCGARNCKLWRLSNTFLEHQSLYCVDCALTDQAQWLSPNDGPVDLSGCRKTDYGSSDQIGGLVPAVPTSDGSTFWGYTSIPSTGVKWWKELPLRADSRRAS